jgi:hypothetical protein
VADPGYRRDAESWSLRVKGGLNYKPEKATRTVDLARAGLNGAKTYSVTDLWSDAVTSATGKVSVELDGLQATILRLTVK